MYFKSTGNFKIFAKKRIGIQVYMFVICYGNLSYVETFQNLFFLLL